MQQSSNKPDFDGDKEFMNDTFEPRNALANERIKRVSIAAARLKNILNNATRSYSS
jgi:hypothetical protein